LTVTVKEYLRKCTEEECLELEEGVREDTGEDTGRMLRKMVGVKLLVTLT